MPASLRELYTTREQFQRVLTEFRTYKNLWAASVMNGGLEDESSADTAEAAWQTLRKLKQKLALMHHRLGFSPAENDAFALPYGEYQEQVTIGEAPSEPARMPDDIKKMLASVLEPAWEKDEHS